MRGDVHFIRVEDDDRLQPPGHQPGEPVYTFDLLPDAPTAQSIRVAVAFAVWDRIAANAVSGRMVDLADDECLTVQP